MQLTEFSIEWRELNSVLNGRLANAAVELAAGASSIAAVAEAMRK